jgi:hypothetical protein
MQRNAQKRDKTNLVKEFYYFLNCFVKVFNLFFLWCFWTPLATKRLKNQQQKIDRYFKNMTPKQRHFPSFFSLPQPTAPRYASTGALVVPSTEYCNPHAARGALKNKSHVTFSLFFCSGSSCFGVFLGEGGKKHHKKRLDKRVMSMFFNKISSPKT